MADSLDTSSHILIIGGGTFAWSTALHLARRGYSHVTVLDRYTVPSPISAGNDVNKIVETCDESFVPSDADAVETRLQYLATQGWRNDPVFKDFYHETGFIAAGCSDAAKKHVWEHEITGDEKEYVKLRTSEDFRSTMPSGVLTGTFNGWEGAWKKKNAGWCHARNALVGAAQNAQDLGVTFVSGESGHVKGLIIESGNVVGCRTLDGQEHWAARTILAAGAGCQAIFDMQDQLRPTAWTLCHLKVTVDEAKLYRNLPVLFNVEKGFFMEPDEDNLELKICDEHPGYCNWITDKNGHKRSVPFARQNIPLEAETRARDFLRDCMPHLAKRDLVFARICWCADTPDRRFLIGPHPTYQSLILACGGSGHGLAHIPSVGSIVADSLERKLDPILKDAFRWRPETALNRDWTDTQDRFGGPNKVMDFQTIDRQSWTDLPPRL